MKMNIALYFFMDEDLLLHLSWRNAVNTEALRTLGAELSPIWPSNIMSGSRALSAADPLCNR
jgi:hypothetical protein